MRQPVRPRELAQRLGIDPKVLRAWLRRQAASGHPLLREHQRRDNWVFTQAEADQLAAEYRHGVRPGPSTKGGNMRGLATAILGGSSTARSAPASEAVAGPLQREPFAVPASGAQVARDLTGPPVAASGLLPSSFPSAPGVYAWWAAPDVLPDLQYLPDRGRHPSADLSLLYVGISDDLRTRITGKHLGSSTGGSTLRRALAALLTNQLGLVPCWSPNGDRVTLEKASEARLTTWMRKLLYVSWTPHPDPKSVEAEVINILGPPCNVDHNHHHPNCSLMIKARDLWRASAGPRPS